MADKSVDQQASDIFSLGAGFEAQTSSTTVESDYNEALDDLGDQADSDLSNETTKYSAAYQYTGTDLASDLAALLGQVVNSIHIDKIEVRFAAQKPVEVNIEGHNHTASAHAAPTPASGDFDGFDTDLSTLIGASVGGWDVPQDKPWADAGTDSTCIALSLSFEANHNDAVDGAGDHHVGVDSHGMVNAEAQYLGAPTLTTTGWDIQSDGDGDANQDFDKTTVRGTKALSRTTA